MFKRTPKSIVLLCFCVCLTLFCVFSASAAIAPEAVHVPGGTVTTIDELSEALGGYVIVDERENLTLLRDVILDAPLVVSGGEWKINGAGCKIIRGFAAGDLIVVRDGADVTLGRESKESDDVSLMILGGVVSGLMQNGDQTSILLTPSEDNIGFAPEIVEGALLRIEGGSEVTAYFGTEIGENHSELSGGGIICVGGGTFTNLGALIYGCSSNSDGGNFYLADGGVFAFGTGTVTEGYATGNGGNVCIDAGGACEIVAGTIQKGYAEQGGGLYAGGQLLLGGGSISENSALRGGGVFYDGANTIHKGSITENTAVWGGGIYNASDALVAVEVTSAANTAEMGGGLYNAGKIDIQNCVFTASKVTYGGGIYNAKGAELTVASGTIGTNEATYGGGIFNAGKLIGKGVSISTNRGQIGAGLLNEGELLVYGNFYCSDANGTFLALGENGEGSLTIAEQYRSPNTPLITPGVKTEEGYVADFAVKKPLLLGDAEVVAEAAKTFQVAKDGMLEYGIDAGGYLELRLTWLLPAIGGVLAIGVIVLCGALLFKRRKAK